MRISSIVCLSLCVSLSAGTAEAEPFTILPNGELVFNTAFTTSGVLTCGAITACAASGANSVTLGSGASTMTLTFTGVDTTVALGNIPVSVNLGSFTASTTDPAFTFPAGRNPNVPILLFRMTMIQTSPVPGTAVFSLSFGPGGGESLPLLRGHHYISLPTGPNPPGFNYTGLVYSLDPYPFSLRGSGVTELQTVAGAIPEPTTMFLVGTGLAAACLRRRRARSHTARSWAPFSFRRRSRSTRLSQSDLRLASIPEIGLTGNQH